MNTPKIRFKGFEDDWEQRKLGEVSSKITKKNQDIVVDEVFTNSAEYGIISQRDFFDKDIANFENIDGYYIVEPNDFVYNPRISTTAPFGPIKRNKLERTGAMSPLYYVFRPHDIDLSYLECFFQTSCWHTFMRFNGNTGARSDRFAITDKVFDEMPISMPQDIEEQQKIGSYFSSLDNLITLHQRKCDETKQLKKFMLQKMFPKNGEKNPEIRFEGFTDDWEQRKVGEVTKELLDYDNFSSGLPLLTSSRSGLMYQSEYRGNATTENENTLFSVVPLNACTYRHMSDDSTFHLNINTLEKGLVSKEYPVFQENESNLKFIVQYINSSNSFTKFCTEQKKGGTRTRLYYKTLCEYKLMMPSIKEQNKTANFFDTLDHLITLHQRKCEKLKELKKFMLQNMFV